MTQFHIEKLARHHDTEAFDCGQPALNRFLNRFALPNQQASASQTYLAFADSVVIGFYTLVVGEIAYEDVPERLAKGLARHSIPVMVLARMGVDRKWQGHGVGAGLLKDATRRTVQAADIAGIRAFIVHTTDERARAFYEHYRFKPSPTDPLHLYLLVKEIPGVTGEPRG